MRISPVFKITLGLVVLSITLVMIGDFLFDLSSSRAGDLFRKRKEMIESLALTYSGMVLNNRVDQMIDDMNRLLNENSDILSLALKNHKGQLMAVSGDHDVYWVPFPKGASRLHQLQVPIYKENKPWGKLEVRFREPGFMGQLLMMAMPLIKLIFFMILAGFIIFFIYMKRVLFYLDPSSVIPERVKNAMDILAEGVLFLDVNGKIVLANSSFSKKAGVDHKDLIGKGIDSVNWHDFETTKKMTGFPYLEDLLKGIVIRRKNISLLSENGELQKMVMNSSPILDVKEKFRGALISLDDVTELEAAHQKLKDSNEKIERQNERLKHLATRDPMTGCFNRRVMFELLEKEFKESKENGTELCCIMSDIDHFKLFNDNYGHSVGDRVIQIVAKLLGLRLRSRDFVARYGGEEFCIAIVGASLDQTMAVAERARSLIEKEGGRRLRMDKNIHITSSFGISSTKLGAKDVAELIDQADQALYLAKKNGRNRVEFYIEGKDKE